MNIQSKKGKIEAVIDDEVVTGFCLLRKFAQKVRDFFLSFWSNIVFRWRKEF